MDRAHDGESKWWTEQVMDAANDERSKCWTDQVFDIASVGWRKCWTEDEFAEAKQVVSAPNPSLEEFKILTEKYRTRITVPRPRCVCLYESKTGMSA